jgi:hypothetical protein
MSKLACVCGNVISNVVCPCPSEGLLIGDQDHDRLLAESHAALKSFLAALVAGRKEEWIRGFFAPEYPTDTADASVVYDVISHFGVRYQKSVAECDQCGRLFVQVRPGENVYRSYSSDTGGYAAILRSRV